MLIAGNCSYVTLEDSKEIWDTAKELKGTADYFRCKCWLGGTSPDRYLQGVGYEGLELLSKINKEIMPVMTAVQIPVHIKWAAQHDLAGFWIGARNSQNYALRENINGYWDKTKPVMIKRGTSMPIDEVIGMHDIMKDRFKREIFIIERGINTIDRPLDSRWSPDLKGMIQIKHDRPDVFKKMVVDCSHSVGRKEYIRDTYKAFKAIGVKHFMIECTKSGESQVDSRSMVSVKELKRIVR